MANRKIKNPLVKRIPREFLSDWKKYIVVVILLVVIIGVTAGINVANNSMMYALDNLEENTNLEDGYVVLKNRASDEFIKAVENGELADIKGYYKEKAYKEAYDEIYGEDFDPSSPMASVYDKVYEETKSEIDKKIDEEYVKAEKKYELNDPDYKSVQINLYENFFINAKEGNDGDKRVRIYKLNDEINKLSIHKGELPKNSDEIAIDRMHADNVKLKVGDKISVNGKELTIVGLISSPNYTTLHESNTDTMFNALKFDVAFVTEEGFEELSKNENIHYQYSYTFINEPDSKVTEADDSERILKSIITQSVVDENEIDDYIPSYANQAINFAPDDVSGDMVMVEVMMYIFIGILAFIFGVTISTTIQKEATVIGTLRASGYTKGELIKHYMTMPIFVTLLAAIIGNILGYAIIKDGVVALYYNSYSLPVYDTLWNAEAFIKTTIIPAVIVIIVNLSVIVYRLRISPLKFLRNDIKSSKSKRVVKLPDWKFIKRFRTRVLSQNMPNYIILAIGVIFVMFLMCFTLGMPDTLDNIISKSSDMMFVDYQVILKDTEDEDGEKIVTANEDAEKFAIESLIYNAKMKEEVTVYGFVKDSKYFELPSLNKGEVVISKPFADKYDLKVGDSITLDAEYENVSYEMKVGDISSASMMISVFMDIDEFNSVFEKDEGYFSGYMSSSEISDISNDKIAKIIVPEDALTQAEQLKHSIGGMMKYVQYACVIIAAILIYLLTKIIIEKNEIAISMTKILGYYNGEIASIYLVSTVIVMVVIETFAVFAGRFLMGFVWKIFLLSMPGWYEFYMSPVSMVKNFAFVFVAFLCVMLIDYVRIRKIPMTEALKNNTL